MDKQAEKGKTERVTGLGRSTKCFHMLSLVYLCFLFVCLFLSFFLRVDPSTKSVLLIFSDFKCNTFFPQLIKVYHWFLSQCKHTFTPLLASQKTQFWLYPQKCKSLASYSTTYSQQHCQIQTLSQLRTHHFYAKHEVPMVAHLVIPLIKVRSRQSHKWQSQRILFFPFFL